MTLFISIFQSLPTLGYRVGKWCFSVITAFTVTICLVALMHVLITGPKIGQPKTKTMPPIDIVIREKIIKNRTPPPPEKPVEVTPPPVVPSLALDPIEGETITLAGMGAPPSDTFSGSPAITTGRFPIARMMVSPEYPYRAAQKGIEGYVDVRFDVTKTGATENIQVIAAVPDGVFNNAAVKAIKRWKFTPYEKEGKPVFFSGMSKRLTFDLEN